MEKQKAVKDYLQMFQNNSSKIQTYQVTEDHENVLRLLVEFINSLTIDKDIVSELLELTPDLRI